MTKTSQINNDSLESEGLLFRRQYIIAPSGTKSLEGWIDTDIGNSYVASAHPHLSTTKVQHGDSTLVVLGFLLDPFDPFADDEKIAKKLIEQASSFIMLQNGLKYLGGRYVIIFNSRLETRIFSDPAGFRQIFYHKDSRGMWWFSSQPSLMAEFHDLQRDEDVLEDLGKLDLFRNTEEYWFPGQITLFKDVFHLTPNHYFDIKSGKSVRYWPTEDLEPVSKEDCIENAALILNGLMKSAANRYDLAMGFTAGLDTRILLAASKDVAKHILFFTHTHDRLAENNADITIPKSISNKFGLNYEVVKHTKDISDNYRNTFHINVSFARENKLVQTYSIQKHFSNLGNEYVVVNGICGEITRCFHRLPPFIKISSKTLALLVNMKGSFTAESEFNRWLIEVKGLSPSGYNLLDLFYWENRNSNWAAMSYHEYDMGFESLSPFNCRQILETFLGVDRSLRLPRKYQLHRELIKHMWPDLMDWPINPPESLKERLLSRFKGTRFYELLRMMRFIIRYLINY